MKKELDTQIIARKPYDKPSWEKQDIFERFTLACPGLGTIKASPGPTCTRIGS